MDKEEYGKPWLIRKIAKKANFTIGDVYVVWNAFEEVVMDIIREKKTLSIGGLFKIWVQEIPERDGWDAIRNIPAHYPATDRIYIKPSRGLLKLLKNRKE